METRRINHSFFFFCNTPPPPPKQQHYIILVMKNKHTLPGQAVESLWSDCASRILGLPTASPIGSCSFLPAKASCENAVWQPGVSSMSMKCSSSGMLSSSGNSNRPMRAWSSGVLNRHTNTQMIVLLTAKKLTNNLHLNMHHKSISNLDVKLWELHQRTATTLHNTPVYVFHIKLCKSSVKSDLDDRLKILQPFWTRIVKVSLAKRFDQNIKINQEVSFLKLSTMKSTCNDSFLIRDTLAITFNYNICTDVYQKKIDILNHSDAY